MAIPKNIDDYIEKALEYIDEHGEPSRNQSREYNLITQNGKRYSPKYVIAVADHLANRTPAIRTEDFNAVEAVNYFKSHGFNIENKQQINFELTITAADVPVSTDKRFTMANISLGDNYEPVDVYFQNANGEIIKRERNKGEKKISNQTMPRLACQIFEKQLEGLSAADKENFPVCRYSPDDVMLQGIYASEADYKKYRNSIECMTYNYDGSKQFVIYCWNIFSTIIFVQECLKRFGSPGDKFVLTYRYKKGYVNDEATYPQEDAGQQISRYSAMLLESKNLIFRGAPGTGKTYLAKQIAANIISNGEKTDYNALTPEQKQQMEFVQFHPSYDYSDFVEGLRPKVNEDGTMGFELKDGIFKIFVDRARKNYEDADKPQETLDKETSVQEAIAEFLSDIEFGKDTFKTVKGREFTITDMDDKYIYLQNAIANKLTLNLNKLKNMLESKQEFKKIKDVTEFFKTAVMLQQHSYYFAIYNAIKDKMRSASPVKAKREERKNYVFIIDEINRGEISKIFGELFFAIDPGYRGKLGEISTQYANMHSDPDIKFYIPENVYIIGTMNDIDRSVDSFDFAMRRRFRFVEIKANEQTGMLLSLPEDKAKEAIRRMTQLNNVITNVEDLNENYQIGAAYFLKLEKLGGEKLWADYLQPLLQEYIQGMPDEKALMKKFAEAYYSQESDEDNVDETSQNQG